MEWAIGAGIAFFTQRISKLTKRNDWIHPVGFIVWAADQRSATGLKGEMEW